MDATHKYKVLVVDDDLIVLRTVSRILGFQGYTVVGEVQDGAEAVEKVRLLHPDVIVMDMQMPKLDGISAARRIQELSPTPIVMLTAHVGQDLVKQAAEAGVGAYLRKPLDPDALHRAITIAMARFEDLQALRRLNAQLQAEVRARQKAEQEALRAKEEWERTFNAVSDLIMILDKDYRMVRVNKAAAERLACTPEACVGRLCYPNVHDAPEPPGACPFARLLADGMEHTQEISEPHLGGTFLVTTSPLYDNDGALSGCVHVAHDITERKQMEAQLQKYTQHLEQQVEEKVAELEKERAKIIQMDKMAALGQLATGVAHELRQPLTAINFEGEYLKSVADKVEEGNVSLETVLDVPGLREIGTHLIEDVARCQRITDHLRTFGRVSTSEAVGMDINAPIRGSLILSAARLREHSVDVRLRLSDGLPLILADPNRLEQVFLNLIANAEYALNQAVPETSLDSQQAGGTSPQTGGEKILEITTALVENTVVATVYDNGCGMSEEVQKHLFEPFFTTKPEEEGTGLGLSISYGIITEYGGEITCESALGKGTKFTLRFPVADV